ncbi:hypothetical protein EJ02DRAFT_425441 [Clathrospora elynae]|uniref:Uncharacterized protein n=1 Tax=Clathrospora elynae TaxID=706981 RepID=A0A6A5SH70_9PLEO|nr:hypothetical protein EJ02DRAFT_425441 [Clathrospora elynae]
MSITDRQTGRASPSVLAFLVAGAELKMLKPPKNVELVWNHANGNSSQDLQKLHNISLVLCKMKAHTLKKSSKKLALVGFEQPAIPSEQEEAHEKYNSEQAYFTLAWHSQFDLQHDYHAIYHSCYNLIDQLAQMCENETQDKQYNKKSDRWHCTPKLLEKGPNNMCPAIVGIFEVCVKEHQRDGLEATEKRFGVKCDFDQEVERADQQAAAAMQDTVDI